MCVVSNTLTSKTARLTITIKNQPCVAYAHLIPKGKKKSEMVIR